MKSDIVVSRAVESMGGFSFFIHDRVQQNRGDGRSAVFKVSHMARAQQIHVSEPHRVRARE